MIPADPSHNRHQTAQTPATADDTLHQLTLRLPPPLREQVREHARCRCMTVSMAAVELIRQALSDLHDTG